MPEVAGFISYVRGLTPISTGKNDPRGKGRMGLAFGSHGWSGGGATWVEQELDQIGYELSQEVICCVYRPDQSTLQLCRQAGTELGEKACKLASE